jgi:hypothetical protein
MKASTYVGALLLVLALVSVAWYFGRNASHTYKEGFQIVSLEDNEILISDSDIQSYNWTSQEIAITDSASRRLLEREDSLYSLTSGFMIKINGEELYRGVFRMAIHSAIPPAPQISIMFPSMLFSFGTENYNAMMMFYPFFEPPGNQPEADAKLFHHFESAGKIIY